MATISFTLPANIASGVSTYLALSGNASGGGSPLAGDTLSLQVPSFALPAPVVAGLADAGIPVPAAVEASGASVVIPDDASVGLAQFAPAGLMPQGDALGNPDLAGANAVAQNLTEAANAFFQEATANGGEINLEEIASFAAQQNQTILNYFGGM